MLPSLSLRAAALALAATVVVGLAAPRAGAQSHTIGLARDPQLAALLADVRPARIRATDSVLVSFGTRNTFSDTLSATRGIGAARRWIHAQFSDISRQCGGCLRVEYDAEMIQVARAPQRPTVNVVNVLAILPGRDTNRVIVMGGHYDSCICSVRAADNNGVAGSFDPTSDAPGADDDGSGTSAIIELARVFAARHPKGLEATIIFAAYAAEEQGLLGSTHLAERLHREGKRVVAGMTDDMVGNVVGDDGRRDADTVRIFSDDPDNGPGRELARYVWGLAETYQPTFAVLPVFRLDRVGRGGDHAPFARRGDAALRFAERLENWSRNHLSGDVLAHVDFDYVAKVARLNAATVGALAAAPATPDSVTSRRTRGTTAEKWQLAWKPVPGAASYEVLVRRTTSPTWERVIPVAGTQHGLDVQLDDAVAGVRAVGANGHRSLASVIPPAAPPRPAARAGAPATPGAP
jgi:hypothetical protein